MIKYFTFFLLLISSLSFAQTAFRYDQNIAVTQNDEDLSIPFAGGINAAQIQTMDVDGDGIEELVIWDINARQTSVFKISGNSYIYLPEMSYFFPSDVNGFLVLADYDGDGKKDLFTSSPFGIRAYRNVSLDGAGFPTWELAQNFLRLDNNSNLQANNLDIPLIMDVDGDGDLDIATFNFASGDFLEFYKNTSVERKGVPDIDGFAFPEARWGGFEFCDCGSFSFGVTCAGFPMGRVLENENKNIEHAGGHSILYADFDGDGTFDLLMGQDECDVLYFLPNKGTNAVPVFDEFSNTLPNVGDLPAFPIFHAAQIFQDKLIISTNSSSIAGPFKADYGLNVFYIPLTGSGKEPFLQDQMLDFGENSRPLFKGNKNNGSLIVTANSLIGGRVVGRAISINASLDSWEILDEDYLNLSELDLTDLQFIEYVNTQNQTMRWLAGTDTVNFSLQKKLFFSRDINFQDLEEISVPGITPRPLDHFEFFTYQNLDYLLMSRQTGELVLYSISNSGSPQLTLLERDFLGFGDSPAARNLSVHVIPNQTPSLYAIDQRGLLFFVEDFMNSEERENVGVLIEEEKLDTRLGRSTWLSHVPDPFSSQYDLILGNTAGGIQYLKAAEIEELPNGDRFLANIYPNPTTGPIKIITNQNVEARLINSLGQILMDNITIQANREVELQAGFLAPGVYILNFRLENGQSHSRRVIVRP